ncbi:hypothetical protein EW145_g3153 [Phellinidium pouzarii]|uniref:Major facilitator superfamily (MFS) profile domain-containing protein n=1 Tax=Phellinidium pouzarii TaxID=167371 RepID=A0A4S4L8M7_9AGAM|nr:hypothetical protein EW145_g3153 [Phellinidium pouzarii]
MAEDYFNDNTGDDLLDNERQEMDGRTPLDRTIDRIGMGSYQWTLLALCGFGWLADNVVAIILPRVQQHFDVSDNHIGYLSSSLFAGMMIGAIGWGSCSDVLGRSTAFNLTLFFTAIFGLIASFMPTFSTLCIVLFFLGTSVGGSMPTDGTLLLEHMPKGKQYLVTALSVFFSLGSVLSAMVGIIVIPGYSCPPQTPASLPCEVNTMNTGWKRLLFLIGLITLAFFSARIVFFRLHESPRYLVHAGRPEEALLNLQKISRFNGSELSIDLGDVIDRQNTASLNEEHAPFIPRIAEHARADVRVLFDADGNHGGGESSDRNTLVLDDPKSASTSRLQSYSPERVYDATGSSDVPLDAHAFISPATEEPPHVNVQASLQGLSNERPQSPELKTVAPGNPPTRQRPERPSMAKSSQRSSLYEAKAKVYWALPRRIRKPLWAWLDKLALVLSPEWKRTTMLIWATWCSMALAYTMFNVYLPKMLEMNLGPIEKAPKTLEESMWDVVIFTIGGCPGAIIGAYMIESSFGRRWSLAGSTFVTAASCVAFIFAESSFAVRVTTIGVSLSSTTMWAVLYGWTPEIFETPVRGTACGTASALSRIGGMIAPVLGGSLLVVSRSLPVITSAVVFVIAGICTLMLRVKESSRDTDTSTLVH